MVKLCSKFHVILKRRLSHNIKLHHHIGAVLQTGARFLTERGQNVNGQPNIIYVSTDNGTNWTPLHEFVDVSVYY